MPILDDRTDVLKEIVSRPIKSVDQITVIREIASVVISMSSEVFSLARTVKGENGNDDGLLGDVRRIRADVIQILKQIEELRCNAEKAKAKEEVDAKSTPFAKFVEWGVEHVLPSLATAAILAAVGFTIGVYLHLQIVPAP